MDGCQSLWESVSKKSELNEALTSKTTADVTVIGGGICGLSAALHLAQNGFKVICLEANTIGWGASGRNNGQVIAGLKLDPDKVIKVLGQTQGSRLVKLSGQAPDLVFSLIKQHNIQCDAQRNGWIQPARSNHALKEITARMSQWQKLGAPVKLLDPSTLATTLGTDWYQAAFFDRRGGSINPLAYTHGLMQAVINSGVSIHENSAVVSMQKQNTQWRVKTKNAEVLSKQLLICTNAYGKLDNKLTKTIVPIRTGQIASTPLSESQWHRILPNNESASDASRLLTSFRITADKRLIMGGAYATGGNENASIFNNLKRAAKNRFPFLENLKIEYQWSGYLAITPSHLPHIFKLDGNCHAAIGCNGRGIAMTTMMGKILSEKLMVESKNDSYDCPVPISAQKPVPFHEFRNIGIAANVAWFNLLDRMNK